MDFKIAGTRDGITAVQLDCKNRGLEANEIEATLELSATARMQIIESMETAIAAPRELTDQVERIATYQIPEDKIGLVIGKGGATIKRITRESEAEIDIKRDGTAHITGSSEAAAKAQDMIAEILESAK
jgi:polyribonucleotide nucleotidyltransferase